MVFADKYFVNMNPSFSNNDLQPKFPEAHPQPVDSDANLLFRCPKCKNQCSRQSINPLDIRYFRFACCYCNNTSEVIDGFKLHKLLHKQQQHQYSQYLQFQMQREIEQREREQQRKRDRENGVSPVYNHPFSIRELLSLQSSSSAGSAAQASPENCTYGTNSVRPSKYSDNSSDHDAETVRQRMQKPSNLTGLGTEIIVTADKTLQYKSRSLNMPNPVYLSSHTNLSNRIEFSSPIEFSNSQDMPSSQVLASPLDLSRSSPLDLSYSATMQSLAFQPINPCGAIQSDSEQRYDCKNCGLIFLDSDMYIMHAGFHNMRNPFMCNLCGVITSNKKDFFAHIATARH